MQRDDKIYVTVRTVGSSGMTYLKMGRELAASDDKHYVVRQEVLLKKCLRE